MTSVSAQGAKRGRGRGAAARRAKNLNKGQIMGVGSINMIWPGLNAPVIRGREVVQQRKLPQDKNYLINLLRVRNEMDTFSRQEIHRLERGWHGNSMRGKKIGPPDAMGDEFFEGFESIVLMSKSINTMMPTTGRTRFVNTMCATGNYNGLVGVGHAYGKDSRTGIRRAKNQAGRRLIYVERGGENKNTIVHDFVSQYGQVKVIAIKKPEGFGIMAHRVIRELCRLAGIRDIYVKCAGPYKNYDHVYKAFLTGLIQQKSFQQLADEKRLHVVELKAENDYYPTVVASPSNGQVRSKDEIDHDEVMDFKQYLRDGKVIEIRPNVLHVYHRSQVYIKNIHSMYYRERNRQNIRVYLKAKYGQLDSFLTVREKAEREERRKLVFKKEAEGNINCG